MKRELDTCKKLVPEMNSTVLVFYFSTISQNFVETDKIFYEYFKIITVYRSDNHSLLKFWYNYL